MNFSGSMREGVSQNVLSEILKEEGLRKINGLGRQ